MFKVSRSLAVMKLMVCIMFLFAVADGRGAEGAAGKGVEAKTASRKPGARGFNLLTIGSIDARLGAKGLTDEQKKQIEALREKLKKKYVQINNRDDVIAAKAALKKAGKDKVARKKARTVLEQATGGFHAGVEYQKGLKDILDAAQLEALKASRKRASSTGESAKKAKGKG